MLSGEEIKRQIEKENIKITPFDESCIAANSYYLHLADELLIYDEDVLDCRKENKARKVKIPKSGYVLRPGELYLSRTVEYTETKHFVPVLNGRLSLAALGITVHITAGFGDNGFKGTWTLEICVVKPVKIYPGMRVCHISYFPIIGEENITYKGKYLGQINTTASRIYKDDTFNEVKEVC